jgi:hypothetical protein
LGTPRKSAETYRNQKSCYLVDTRGEKWRALRDSNSRPSGS